MRLHSLALFRRAIKGKSLGFLSMPGFLFCSCGNPLTRVPPLFFHRRVFHLFVIYHLYHLLDYTKEPARSRVFLLVQLCCRGPDRESLSVLGDCELLMTRSLGVWIFLRVSKLYILLWIDLYYMLTPIRLPEGEQLAYYDIQLSTAFAEAPGNGSLE